MKLSVVVVAFVLILYGAKAYSLNFFAKNGIIRGVLISNENIINNTTVALGNSKNQKIHCSGVIIGKKTILTSAHCVVSFKSNELSVYLGTMAKFAEKQMRVNSIKIHEQFSSDDEVVNDIALLELQDEIPNDIEPSKILSTGHINDVFPVTVYGFSRYIHDKNKTIFDYLLGRSDDYFSSEMYNERDEFVLHEKLLAARFQSADVVVLEQQMGGICPGDSGGPTFITINNLKLLLGLNWSVTEAPQGGNSCSREAAVMPLSKFREWIIKNAASEIKFYNEKFDQNNIADEKDRHCVANYYKFLSAFQKAFGEDTMTDIRSSRIRMCENKVALDILFESLKPHLKADCDRINSNNIFKYVQASYDFFSVVCDLNIQID